MPSSTHCSLAGRFAGPVALFALLAACGDRAADVASLSSRALLAEPLEASYRQLSDAAMASVDDCDNAPVLAIALDGWLQAVDSAGLQSRFPDQIAEAQRRTADIRSRCADAVAAMEAATAASADRRASRNPADDRTHAPAQDPRPALTADALQAYVRGLEEEIRLMRASGSHFVSLSKYDEAGRQVAATAGLSLPEYRGLRDAVHDVLYVQMMHERYAGTPGRARLTRLEPHKREHAVEVLARDPFGALSPAERDAVQTRLRTLRPLYDRYIEIAAVGD